MTANLLNRFVDFGLLPAFILLTFLIFGSMEPRVLSISTLMNVLQQASFLMIPAIAQVFVLLNRGFDLSIGHAISLISVISALVMSSTLGLGDGLATAFGIVTALALGLGIGLINGVLVAYARVNPFVVTLGMQGVLFGLATIISGGFPVSGLPAFFVDVFDRGRFLGVPTPIFVCLGAVLAAYLLLSRSRFGRAVYFAGANPQAAHVAGLPVQRNLMFCYVLCSLFGAVAAILLMARSGSGEPNLGSALMLQSIAAAVVGGVSLRGGEGRVWGAVVGSILLVAFSVGMNMSRIDGNIQLVVIGVIVVAAVYIDRLRAGVRS